MSCYYLVHTQAIMKRAAMSTQFWPFVQNNGIWKLAGITIIFLAQPSPKHQHKHFSYKSNNRDMNFFVRISTYASQIEQLFQIFQPILAGKLIIASTKRSRR